MNRLLRTIRSEGEDAMKTGGFVAVGALFVVTGVLGLAGAIVAGVAPQLGLVWALLAATAFIFVVAGFCFLLAGDDSEPPSRKSSAAPDYSPLLRIVEDVASDFIAGPHERRPAGGSTKALAAALAAGALLGFMEQSSKKSPRAAEGRR